MDNQIPDKKVNQFRVRFSKIAVFAVALILTTVIIMQGNFLEGLLKLLGVGASRLETISVSSIDDFFGRSGAEWIASFESERNQPAFGDTAAFSSFSRQPNDPGVVPGFLMPLWAGGDPLTPVDDTKPYISPIIEIDTSQDILHSIDVLEYLPDNSEIIYKYRVADSPSQLDISSYQTLEFRSNGEQSEYVSKQALLGLPLKRYLQFKITFGEFLAYDRPMVAEFNINYGPESELELSNQDLDMLPDLPVGIPGDLNNDGVVNSIDYAMFLELWASFQNKDRFSPLD